MPNLESEQSNVRNSQKESPNLVSDAYNFADHVRPDIEGRLRQLNLIGYGAVAGGIKDIPNEFFNHPWETIGKVSTAGAIGVGLGAALAADSPIIVGSATAASIALSAASLWHTSVKFFTDKKLMHSLDAVYKSGDKHTMDSSQKVAADVIGPEAFDYGLGIAGGFAGLKLSEKLPLNFVSSNLKPFIPLAKTYTGDAVHMIFTDGSAIHIHGNQAIYQSGGWEYDLNINNNGIDMNALGSITGHQVLEGTRRGHDVTGSGNNFIKVEVDPETKTSSVLSATPASYMRKEHSFDQPFGWIWSSCKQCRIEDETRGNSESHANF